MKTTKIFTFAVFFITIVLFSQCNKNNQSQASSSTDKDHEYYQKMKSDVNAEPDENFMQDKNAFDPDYYTPSDDSYNKLLVDLGQKYTLDSSIVVHFDERSSEELKGNKPQDSLIINGEVFTADLHNLTKEDLENLQYNLNMAKSNKSNPETDGGCSGKDCMVYTHVDKSEQKLYLYLNGQPLDTFDTSTARKGYNTPDFDKKPDGRMFKKYSSHTYPGGNYNGLGNMPYAVFISGGYAIHGATSGEIHELGKPASHGCIRIHPKNAKIYYNLVKYAGAENTWVHVTD